MVSDREREDLDVVAEALGMGGVEEALRRLEALPRGLSAHADVTLTGRTVCFTGALLCCHEGAPLTRELAERFAAKAGLVVVQRVTKSLDLLVVADPNSMSGKAEKARRYGTRIVAETVFWPMIGVDVE